MQKFNTPCIKTGDFARLCGTNKRTLIHYDEIGLFRPAYTDENGYRYYSENQCDLFFTITCLKELGMPLKEIREYIHDQNPASMEHLLLEQQKKAAAELKRLHRIQNVINTKLSLLRQAEELRAVDGLSDVRMERQEADELLVLSAPLFTADHDRIFPCLCAHIGECGRHCLNCGHPYGAMLPMTALSAGDYETYAYFFTKVSIPGGQIPDHLETHLKRKGNYAVVYLRGDYYRSAQALDALLSYVREQGLTPGDYVYKEAVLDEFSANEEEYLTRICTIIKDAETRM